MPHSSPPPPSGRCHSFPPGGEKYYFLRIKIDLKDETCHSPRHRCRAPACPRGCCRRGPPAPAPPQTRCSWSAACQRKMASVLQKCSRILSPWMVAMREVSLGYPLSGRYLATQYHRSVLEVGGGERLYSRVFRYQHYVNSFFFSHKFFSTFSVRYIYSADVWEGSYMKTNFHELLFPPSTKT
jgi:hypothetical protein